MAKTKQPQRWKRHKTEWKPGLKLLGHYFVVVVWVWFAFKRKLQQGADKDI